MKTKTFTAVLFLCFWGCSSKLSAQLTQKQQDKIKKEIIAVDDSIFALFDRSDIEAALLFYSPNFVAFGSGGERYDLQQTKQNYLDMYKTLASTKWIPYHLDFLLITKNKVVIIQDGKNELIMKSGGRFNFDPSHYTFAFEKIAGQWKLCYHHFSGQYVKVK
jgi:hypothetical protein